MATTKDRINISLKRYTKEALQYMAKRDQMPLASKAADLLDLIVDIEEDRMLEEIALKRDVKGVRWIRDSDKIWK